MTPARPPLLRVTGWPVWGVPRRLLASVLLVETFALALVAAGAVGRVPVGVSDIGTAALLCGAAVLHTEAVLGIERIRRGSQESHHVDLNSVWTFAGALLLPPVVAATAVLLVYAYLFARVQRPTGIPAYKQVYSAATVVIAVHAASAVVHVGAPGQPYDWIGGTATLFLALLAYTVVNTCLVLGVVAMASPEVRILRILGSGDEVVLELATLSLGALVAIALGSTAPFAVLLVIPPILVLHRTILVRKLQERADTDPKTGLMNSAAWHSRSRTALRRAEDAGTSAGLLMIDLDHFKAVNDRHGHLAGDDVLEVVAATLREQVRDHDLVGRFGGEEFVVLLPHLPDQAGDPDGTYGPDEVRRIGDRIRARVCELRIDVGDMADIGGSGDVGDAGAGGGVGRTAVAGVTVSVGGAVFPRDGSDLTALMASADAALYAAKRSGRNAVRMGSDLTDSRPGGDAPVAG